MSNYVYIKSEPQLWTVGFYAPDGKWHTDSDHSAKDEAAQRVNFLNGGTVSADADLLAACEGALRELKRWNKNTGAWAVLQSDLKNAIAKAKGEQ